MDTSALNLFLSEENIKRHLDHVNTISLKYSILEKSEPAIEGKTMREIARMHISRDLKEEALELLWRIKSHKLFFISFSSTPKKSTSLLKQYSSRESFLYSLFEMAREKDNGFLYVYKDRSGEIKVNISSQMEGAFIKWEPILALDLYEHSYFSDYLFKKERYLREALMYFDTGKIL